MFLISRANSLPRRASLTAFWCLVVAHLEWPLIGVSYLSCCLKVAKRVYVDRCGPRIPADAPKKATPSLSVTEATDGASLISIDDIDEQMMDATVAGHLRVKRRRQHGALPHRDDVPRGPGKHLHTVTDPLDPGRADEHRTHRIVETRERDIALKRVDLSSKSIAPHRHIDGAQWERLPSPRAGV